MSLSRTGYVFPVFSVRTWYDLKNAFGTVIPNRMELHPPPPPYPPTTKKKPQPTLWCPFFHPFSYLVTIFTNKEHCFCYSFWSNISIITLHGTECQRFVYCNICLQVLHYLSFFIHVIYMLKLVTSQNISKIRQRRHVLP